MTMITTEELRSLYLDLLKRSLTNWIHGHEEFIAVEPTRLGKILKKIVYPENSRLVKLQPFDPEKRLIGQDWPTPLLAHTMVGMKRLDNLQKCIASVIEERIPGDFIETGVWKGGSTIFMQGMLKTYNEKRQVWVADSFQGLPAPNVELYPEDADDIHYTIDSLRVSEEQVKKNFAAYDFLDDNVIFLKGWFSNTLPKAPIEKLSILRLDGDMYESTIDALENLYPKLQVGGYIIIDDYCITTCEKAVSDYRKKKGITEEIIDIDGTGVYWRRLS